MDHEIRVTLVANAGLLIQYHGISLLLDGIFGPEGHPFSNLKPEVWHKMLKGESPFEKIDYLLFTHAHPDHFSAALTMEYLRQRKIKGMFLPNSHKVTKNGLDRFLRDGHIPAVILSHDTDRAAYQIEPGITVRAFSTHHLDKKYEQVHHYCYLITLGDKHLLFTADVDYVNETLEQVRDIPLQCAFVNPLFFNDLRRKRFFHGELQAKSYCIYHVPFSQDDSMGMRPVLANEMVRWPWQQPETFVLCDVLQHITL